MVQFLNPTHQQPVQMPSERAILGYATAHERLYGRPPRDVRVLTHEWVVVNGAQMRASELEHLTHQLVLEYNQTMTQRKSIVLRLLKFFREN